MKDLVAFSARAIALLWAAFWMYFFIAETLSTGTGISSGFRWFVLGLLFLVLALIPWRWEIAGAWCLAAVAVIVGAAYAIWSPKHLSAGVKIETTILFSVPPLLAGFLFFAHRRLTLHRA